MKKSLLAFTFLVYFSLLNGQDIISNPFIKIDDFTASNSLRELPGGNMVYIQFRYHILNDPLILFEEQDSTVTQFIKLNENNNVNTSHFLKSNDENDIRFYSNPYFDAVNDEFILEGGSYGYTGTWPDVNFSSLYRFNTNLELLQHDTFSRPSNFGGASTLMNSQGNIMHAGYVTENGEIIGGGVYERNRNTEIVKSNFALPFISPPFDSRKENNIIEFNNPTEYHAIFDDTIAVLNEELDLIGAIPYEYNFDRTPSVAHPTGEDSYWFGGWRCFSFGPAVDSCYEVAIKVNRDLGETEYHILDKYIFESSGFHGQKGAFSARYPDRLYMTNNVEGDNFDFVALTSFKNDGEVRWRKKLVNTDSETSVRCFEILATRDEGVIVTARITSQNNAEKRGFYFIRFDKDGNLSEVLADTEEAGLPPGLQIREVVAYPNPVQNVLHFSGDLPGSFTLEIYDVRGVLQRRSTLYQSAAVSTGDLAEGQYVYRLLNEAVGLNTTGKFVKAK